MQAPVDVVVLNRVSPILQHEVIRDGVRLYEASAMERRLFEVRSFRDHVDASVVCSPRTASPIPLAPAAGPGTIPGMKSFTARPLALALLALAVVSHAEEPAREVLKQTDAAEVEGLKKSPPAKGAEAPPGRTAAVAADPASARAPQPGQELSFDLGGGVTLACVWIPPGEFMMGSPESEAGRAQREGPPHRVKLTQGFWLGKYEVTQEQYERVTGQNPSQFKGARNPVETVNWHTAVAFCDALSKQVGKPVHLPTEAEWEYACRAGTTTAYHSGPNDSDLAKAGWCKSDSGETTHVVGAKSANAWGLFDMHGNVGEWCADWHDENYYGTSPATDPQGPDSGMSRVLRGGSWKCDAGACRVASRFNAGYPDMAYNDYGFRVVLPPGQP